MIVRYSWGVFSVLMVSLALSTGCSDVKALPDGSVADGGFDSSTPMGCEDELEDRDKDGIPNGVEGCKAGIDSDSDSVPDWQDFDSDNDGIPDSVEAGTEGSCGGTKKDVWPCDTDGDGIADYRDLDSDADGVDDGSEDGNGDGRVGCCLKRCGEPTSAQKTDCTLGADGCGPGQSCESGLCTPALVFGCSNGETSSILGDTFGDGVADKDRGSFICRDATEDDPRGRKRVRLIKSAEPRTDPQSGDWHIALEPSARYGILRLETPRDRESLAAIDHEGAEIEVAGFVLSMPATDTALAPFVDQLVQRIQRKAPANTTALAMRSAGTLGKSHDKYSIVRGTTVELTLGSGSDVSTVRNKIVAALMGRSEGTILDQPASYGAKHTQLILRFSTVRRFAFARDTLGALVLDDAGYPKEDLAKKDEAHVVMIGAVAAVSAYEDTARPTGFIVDDLAGGSQLATYQDRVSDECDVGHKAAQAKADVVWVIDESQSVTELTQGIRDNIQASAAEFFKRAAASGLDFRMAVTGIVSPDRKHDAVRGKFCSEDLSDPDAVGGDPKVVDRFLTPQEQSLFGACIKNPYGREGGAEYGLHTAQAAISRHLKVDGIAAGGLLRKDAKTVVIIATDEPSKTVIDDTAISNTTKGCEFGPGLAADVQASVDPFISFFGALQVDVHLIGFVCSSIRACTPKDQIGRGIAHGYLEVVRALGGIVGDVCQSDLSATLQAIVDSVAGSASPLVLQRVPIATSLAVAVSGKEVPRSRDKGFDYHRAKNTVVFYGDAAKVGDDVVVSYRRWERQVTIK